MNCWKGICKYMSDDAYCLRDGGKCDLERIGSPGAKYHTCHYERENDGFKLTCRDACYSYDWCEET